MASSPAGRNRLLALFPLIVLLTVPVASAEIVTLAFSGEITEVIATPPAPFEGVGVGDDWSLSYTFDTAGALDVDGSVTAGQYRQIVTEMTLTISGITVSGAPGAAVSSQPFSSVIAVNLGLGYADYTAQVGLPAATAWAQVALSDEDGTPFTSDALPTVIPTPYNQVFPDYQNFSLRMPQSSQLFLRGQIGATVTATHTKVRADLEIEVDDSGWGALSLVLGLPDELAVAYGDFECPGCEVMGFEPSPFVWFVDPSGGTPDAGEAVVTFNLDNPGGDVMGVEPSPFKVLLDIGEGGFGEIDFSQATGYYPGPLGSLYLEGIRIILPDGTRVDLQGFEIYDAFDPVSLSGTRIQRSIVADEPVKISLVHDPEQFGTGGIASGQIICPGCEVMGVEPSPFTWAASDPTGAPPGSAGDAVITFDLDSTGAVTGVGESPFEVHLHSGDEVLAELVLGELFGYFPGTFGSLELEGFSLLLPDDSTLAVDAVDIYDVDDHVALVGTRIDLRVTLTAEETRADLIINSEVFGGAGFASGSISSPGEEVMGVEPSPFRWVVDPDSPAPPDDFEAAVTYISPPGSEVMGVEPSPFRYFVVDEGGTILSEVDFGDSTGRWGSLHLEGVDVRLEDGSVIEVQSIDTLYRLVVAIDIKPDSEINTINLGSSGVIPVAILSSASFDATMVDPETISLSGASVKLVGNGKRYLAKTEDVNDDGLDDLMCHVLTEEIDIAPGESVVVLEAVTFDGRAISGHDYIRIVPE